MRKCKHYMKIRSLNDFSPAFIHPDFFLYRLTVRAAAAAAGILMDLHMPAIGTMAHVETKLPGFTV